MLDKTNKCLDDIRYAHKYKIPLEKVLNSYGTYADSQYISKETYKNFCFFIYKTDFDNEEILKKINKYRDYETYIGSKNNFVRFFIERTPQINISKKRQAGKYTTYSAHGHFSTNNPISAFLNYIAMLPAYILIITIGGIAKVFVNFFNLFKSGKIK